MSDATELLPCPFCGGEADYEEIKCPNGKINWSIGCPNGAADCTGYQSLQEFARKTEAAAAWNRRAPRVATAEMVAAVGIAMVGTGWSTLEEKARAALRAMGYEVRE